MNILLQVPRSLSTIKALFPFCLTYILLFTWSCGQGVDKWESFGEQIPVEKVQDTNGFIKSIGSTEDSVTVKFSGEIQEVCQAKGCWMTLKSENGDKIRVTFKDYGFFVPKDAANRQVIIEGVASVGQLDEETARHYADDEGREFDPSEDLKEVSVIASGVLIQKAPSQL
ncbi:MAG: DUF4920 domain-containing protein [Marinoscillum sp.]